MKKGVYRNPAIVILLSFITCSIYLFYWVYAVSTELKDFLGDESINPVLDILLTIFCFYPYSIYLSYIYGKKISEAKARVGLMPEDNSILYIILSVFGLFIVNQAIIQNDLNAIWDRTNNIQY